jgi:integrase/recombinase XerD
MSHRSLHHHLDAYLSVREALGFQMRAERTLLRDFVSFVVLHGDGGPIRAQLAVDWAVLHPPSAAVGALPSV